MDAVDNSLVRDMCRMWGREYRRLFGYEDVCRPGATIRVLEGRSEGERDPMELYRHPDAQAISLAIRKALELRKMSYKQHLALYCQYVIPGPLKNKAADAGVTEQGFCALVRRAHGSIWPYIGREQNV